MAREEDLTGGVLVQVCLECGNEYYFEEEPPAADLECQKCGNGVFRSFYSQRNPDEVSEDFADATERDTNTDDPATDITRGDLQDLNNL